MLIVSCPHCNNLVWIEQINCSIFRHAVMCTTFEQINPHSSKSTCDNLFNSGSIYGCGKPFRIVPKENGYEAIICDYI